MSNIKKGDNVIYNILEEERPMLDLIGSDKKQVPAVIDTVEENGTVRLTAKNGEATWEVHGASEGTEAGTYQLEATAEETSTGGGGPDEEEH